MESGRKAGPGARAAVAAIALTTGALAATGCITAVEEAAPSPPSEPAPAALAFIEDEGPADGAGGSDTTPAESVPNAALAATPGLVDSGEAAAWVQITDSARIGVHSAPDSIYTRVGILEPGVGVLGTGRRVVTGDAEWMEINWSDGTAWVLAAAFAPAG